MDALSLLVSALERDERVLLATIIAASGSTPVPAGAHLLLCASMPVPAGTIGGGCIEADVIEEGRRLLPRGSGFALRTFHLSEDDPGSGMLCGGRIEVLLELIQPEERAPFVQALALRQAGTSSVLATVLPHGDAPPRRLLMPAGAAGETERPGIALEPGALTGSPGEDVGNAAARALLREEVIRIHAPAGEIVLEPVCPQQELIIFGGGHVSKFVSRSAAMAGFLVTIVDDRPEYANPRRFPEAAHTLAAHADLAWDSLRISPATSIVIVTRGHKFDEVILERAVQTPARYVGMIGSSRKVRTTFERLIARGTPPEALALVRAPIGLDIGAVTAEEIGISITAELVAVRRGVRGPARPMTDALRNDAGNPAGRQ